MSDLSPQLLSDLKELAARVRARVLIAVHHAKGGHIGGPLSCADMLVAFYFHILNIDPTNPDWEDRDRFILSKGHSTIALYAVLAERGFFPIEELLTFDAIDSRMQGHPDMTKTPGIDMSSGSLGQGISPGIGMAIGARMLGKDFHTYVLMGDGESQEGQVWEAAFVAARYSLDNLTAILDYNGLQQFGWQESGMHMLTPIEHPAKKWQAFGWNTIEVDGHDIAAFIGAVEQAKAHKGQPTVIIAHTVKGKGVSFMEDDYLWHAQVPTEEQLSAALTELGEEKLAPEYLIGGAQ
ncbi:MAG: transketolase [Anaerolineales bacterium]|nr:transketolase [Anaerolineales bacterium]HEY62205.1 transketolase [Anaerolineae bacterium]